VIWDSRFSGEGLFGERLVRLGYASPDQVRDALKIQARRDAEGRAHQLIGMIMVELGMIDTAQLINALKSYELERKEPADE